MAPKERTAEPPQMNLPGNNDLLILTLSNDSDNIFSGTPGHTCPRLKLTTVPRRQLKGSLCLFQ
jgi:hypothetical protein